MQQHKSTTETLCWMKEGRAQAGAYWVIPCPGIFKAGQTKWLGTDWSTKHLSGWLKHLYLNSSVGYMQNNEISFSTSLPSKTCYFSSSPSLLLILLKNSSPNRCEVVSHCGFDSLPFVLAVYWVLLDFAFSLQLSFITDYKYSFQNHVLSKMLSSW